MTLSLNIKSFTGVCEGLENVKGNTTDRNKVFLEIVGVAYLAIFNNKGGNTMCFKARRMNVAISR